MSSTSVEIHFVLNGQEVHAHVEPHYTVLDVLRNSFSLYGARESCSQGLCGCCTVIVDDMCVSGCLYLAVALDGRTVHTIESLDASGELHPVQQAFIDAGAFQCGFCTSGFILMSKQLLESNPNPSDAEIKNHLAGNLCRCAAYPEIVQAVRLAAERMNPSAQEV